MPWWCKLVGTSKPLRAWTLSVSPLVTSMGGGLLEGPFQSPVAEKRATYGQVPFTPMTLRSLRPSGLACAYVMFHLGEKASQLGRVTLFSDDGPDFVNGSANERAREEKSSKCAHCCRGKDPSCTEGTFVVVPRGPKFGGCYLIRRVARPVQVVP